MLIAAIIAVCIVLLVLALLLPAPLAPAPARRRPHLGHRPARRRLAPRPAQPLAAEARQRLAQGDQQEGEHGTPRRGELPLQLSCSRTARTDIAAVSNDNLAAVSNDNLAAVSNDNFVCREVVKVVTDYLEARGLRRAGARRGSIRSRRDARGVPYSYTPGGPDSAKETVMAGSIAEVTDNTFQVEVLESDTAVLVDFRARLEAELEPALAA